MQFESRAHSSPSLSSNTEEAEDKLWHHPRKDDESLQEVRAGIPLAASQDAPLLDATGPRGTTREKEVLMSSSAEAQVSD